MSFSTYTKVSESERIQGNTRVVFIGREGQRHCDSRGISVFILVVLFFFTVPYWNILPPVTNQSLLSMLAENQLYLLASLN